MVAELLELEPECKWPLATAASLDESLGRGGTDQAARPATHPPPTASAACSWLGAADPTVAYAYLRQLWDEGERRYALGLMGELARLAARRASSWRAALAAASRYFIYCIMKAQALPECGQGDVWQDDCRL